MREGESDSFHHGNDVRLVLLFHAKHDDAWVVAGRIGLNVREVPVGGDEDTLLVFDAAGDGRVVCSGQLFVPTLSAS